VSNIVLNPGSGGSTLATDTVSGIDTQIVKIGYSVAGVAPTQVSSSNPLPVTLQTAGATQPVSGTVAVSNFPATQAVTGTFWQATQPVSGTVAATQSGAWSVSLTGTSVVSGTVTANQGTANATPWNENLAQYGGVAVGATNALHVQPGTGATFPVSGTFWQATQPVSIASSVTVAQATAANLNATVTGTVAATQSGTWNIGSITTLPSLPAGSNAIGSVSVSNFPSTQAVSGTVNIGNTVAVTGSLTTTPSTTPQVVTVDEHQYDDDGILYVNPNVPGADIATGDKQQQIINTLANVTNTVSFTGQAIPKTALSTQTLLMVQSQSTGLLDPVEEGDNTNDNDAPGNAGLIGAEVYPRVFDGTYWQRVRGSINGGLLVQESTGQIQRIADLLEAVLMELRTHSVLMASLNQPMTDDPDLIRGDMNSSLQ